VDAVEVLVEELLEGASVHTSYLPIAKRKVHVCLSWVPCGVVA
jgi:hypothetical protein